MARETKLGIALMVLLVGVFGFMVYKKWNSRQPTALAAAGEVSAPEEGADDKSAPAPEPDAEAPASPSEAHPVDIAAGANPFAESAATTIPPRQAEPTGAFADEPFVRNSSAAEAPVQEVPAAEMRPEPFPQGEPRAAETEPLFAESTAPPAQDEESLAAESFVEAAPTAQPTATASPDPFTTAATAATATLTASPAPERDSDLADPAPAAVDDPFAETGDSAGATIAETAPESPFGDVADHDPVFGEATSEPSSALVDSLPTDSTNVGEASDVADQANVAATASEPMEEPIGEPMADPFAGAVSESVAPAPENAEPARLFADEISNGPETESFEPTAKAGMLSESDPTPAATDAVTPVARTQGQSYVVVGENDSYWALSKRVYGTPAYFHALAKYNSSRIKDPNRLKAGMKVLTPERQELESLFPHLISRTASGSTGAQEAKAGLSWDAQGVPIYRVGSSDTLTGIAQAHLGRASRWVQIYEMNRKVVSDPKTLRPGTVLRLPADASRVRLVPQG